MVELMDKKYPKKEMLTFRKNLDKNYQLRPHRNGAKLIEKKNPVERDLFRSNGHSVEAAPLSDSFKTAQRHVGPSLVYHI